MARLQIETDGETFVFPVSDDFDIPVEEIPDLDWISIQSTDGRKLTLHVRRIVSMLLIKT